MAKQLGEICSAPAECDSNACADGVCCDRACTRGCERCNTPSAPGSCVVDGAGDKCGIRCVDGGVFVTLVCDGSGPDCAPGLGGGQTCGGAGCVVLPSGKNVCAQCSATVPCSGAGEACVDGTCVGGPTPAPAGCQRDADCGRADLACLKGACTARATNDFSSIEPLPLDESCGCRVPGAGGSPEPLSAGAFAIVCAGLGLLRRRTTRRRRAVFLGVVAGFFAIGSLTASACSPQEDLPANQACLDTPIALSAVVLACTDDYTAARRVGNGFEGKYRCNASDVNDTPRYYRCPADLRALPCADVKAANEDYEQLLGRSAACRLLFSHPDGGAIPPVATTATEGGGGAGGEAGSAGSAGAAGGAP